MNEEFVWRWLVRITILGLILWWAFRGLEPSNSWIGLIAILLGGTSFLPSRKNRDPEDKEEQDASTLGKVKRVPKAEDHSRSEFAAVYPNWTVVVA